MDSFEFHEGICNEVCRNFILHFCCFLSNFLLWFFLVNESFYFFCLEKMWFEIVKKSRLKLWKEISRRDNQSFNTFYVT